jgi:sugar/nucleoside kinase (ribokinase family)
MAPRDMQPGSEYPKAIAEAISKSKMLVLILTKNANQSLHVTREVERAVSRRLEIIPFRVEDVTLSSSLEYLISTCHWLNASTPPFESHLRHLADVVKERLSVPASADAILTVGSGVGENVLTIDKDVEIGEKHIAQRAELFGGSGLNYTFRLSSTGHTVLPILSIGNDLIGHRIQNWISETVRENNILQFASLIEDKSFLCKGLTTPQSTIIVSKNKRTIFTEKMLGAERFKTFALDRLDALEDQELKIIKAVMIGHIYADSPALNPPEAGEVTKAIIDRFRGKALIFVNFGESQISLGHSFWKETLKHIDIFQLSLSEVRKFFSDNKEVSSLVDMVRWFRSSGITVVITVDKFGAIATFKDGRDGLILAWPYEMNIVDSTGAGDAFGAGLVSMLYKKEALDFDDFQKAIKKARVWAAYACKSIGGANDCPDNSTLHTFELELMGKEFNSVEVRNLNDASLILRLIDKAY